ncbi:MAG: histidine kinase [Bacteroidetes bacterium]|nr:histidine kinase [Bacteroidota bacterium]
MKRIWVNSVVSSLIAVAVYIYVYYSETTAPANWRDQWMGLVLAVFLSNLVGLGWVYMSKMYHVVLPWQKQISWRFGAEMITGIVLSFLGAALFWLIYSTYFAATTEIVPLEHHRDGIIKLGILTIVLIYGYSLVSFLQYSYKQYSASQIESLASERIQMELRLESLKSQLNPHFLFNALNTISSLIYIDINQAESYIRQLAKTYNYILDTDGYQLVKLQDELEMIRAYFFMHKIKYNESAELIIDEQVSKIEGYVPPFCLQILVENAFKHSEISESNPLTIEIFDDKGEYLMVRNNRTTGDVKKGSANSDESYKIGLENIRNRYKHLINKKIRVTFDDHFMVALPLIKPSVTNGTQ